MVIIIYNVVNCGKIREMKERNKHIESDGLFWESDTHEWFNDKSSTHYAQGGDVHGTKLNVVAFVVRDKNNGQYDRVLMDAKDHQIIYETKSLEELGVKIDMLKSLKRFNQ